MSKKHPICLRLFLGLLITGIMLLMTPLSASADAPLRDKEANTAFITKKSANWVDYDNYLAELTLSVNGTQVLTPLDVVICLDRSGSMDMHYIQISEGNHSSSCPCLNQDHFYLKPLEETAAPDDNPDEQQVYDNLDGTLTVYNAESKKWMKLDAGADSRIHLYYEFGAADSPSPMELAAYHFKMKDGEYVRISRWDTQDIRRNQNLGVWRHADETYGCFDRWIEAKAAVAQFSKAVLDANPNNNVALVPFSFRDSTMVNTLNNWNGQDNRRLWLIEQNGTHNFFDENVAIGEDKKLSGTYNSVVSLTADPDQITNMLPRLFTTANTDYVYGLSMAYNLLQARDNEAKATKRAVVVFLSDGKPYPSGGPTRPGGKIEAFPNADENVYALAKTITSADNVTETGKWDDLWQWRTPIAAYQRHDILEKYWIKENGKCIGVPGLGAQLVTVGYMLDAADSITRLKNMASDPESFIEIPASSDTAAGYLTKQLLHSSVFPGGRNAELKDEISKYFYVPEDNLPDGVTLEGTIAGGQTLVWDLGNIYKYAKDKTITVPLVLRDEYRDVKQTTYYPTNADTNPEPPLTTPTNGPDGPDTGAKLYYTDPNEQLRYDTIGTPKLPVKGEVTKPKHPNPETPVTPQPTEPTVPPIEPTEPTEPTEPPTTTPSALLPTPRHGNTVTPVDGTYIEFDENGVPLGEWKVSENGEWIFDEYPPLFEAPQTGVEDPAPHMAVLGLLMIVGVALLLRKRQPREKD